MIKYILLGGSFAFAAAIQPGPLQAFLISRVATVGWRRTLPASLAPLLSDGPIALVAMLFLAQLPHAIFSFLQGAGGILLIYFAVVSYRRWRESGNNDVDPAAAPRTIGQAVLVNLLNPSPYLEWALVLGPAARVAWVKNPAFAVGLIGSFYVTMVIALAAFILLIGTVSFLGTRAQRLLLGFSTLLLAGLGLYLLGSAVWKSGIV